MSDNWLNKLFEKLGETWVANLTSSDELETLHFDFKTVNPATPFHGSDDKNSLARALSGFANANGGIIAWGVDARAVDGRNRVMSVPAIDDPKKCESRLWELTPRAVCPVPAGVVHKSIVREGGRGVVVTLVPPSDGGPHMAMMGDVNHRYFTRAGDNFLVMEHFQIADMFGRRPIAALSIQHRLRAQEIAKSDGQWHSANVSITVSVMNKGRGIARFPFIRVAGNRKASPIQTHSTSRQGWALIGHDGYKGDHQLFVGGSDDVVHPGVAVDVCRVLLSVNQDQVVEDVRAEVCFGCDGVAPQAQSFLISGSDIYACALERAKASGLA